MSRGLSAARTLILTCLVVMAAACGGEAASDDDEAVLNGGLTFLVHPLLQLDARVGAGLTDAAPDFFVGVGIARRW